MYDKIAELYDLFSDWKDYRAEAEKIHALIAARNPERADAAGCRLRHRLAPGAPARVVFG